ncbi:DUF7134 domain-containing protein [Streptomyces sp. NPDC005151]
MQGDIDRRTHLLDIALAVAIGAAVLAAAYAASGPDALDLLLVAVGTLALAGHRRAPRAVLAVTTVSMLGYVVHAHPGSWAAFPVLAAVHAAARNGHRVGGIAAGVLFLAGYFTVLIVAAPSAQDTVERTLLLLGWFLCAGVTGLIDKNWQAPRRAPACILASNRSIASNARDMPSPPSGPTGSSAGRGQAGAGEGLSQCAIGECPR